MSWVTVEHDLEHWVYLPVEDDELDGIWKDGKDWARSTALALREFNDLDRKRKEEKQLAEVLLGMREAYRKLEMAREHYLYFANPHAKPLPVLISYGPSDENSRDEALRTMARADATDVMIPPQTEEFTGNRTLGTGLRTRSYVQLDDGSVIVNLWYAFRSEEHGVDLVALAGADDLGVNEAAEPAFDELVQGIWLLGDDVDLLEGIDDPDIDRLGLRDK